MSSSPEKRRWFEKMIDRYEKPLMAYTLRMLGNLEDAREVVQETFLKLWEADRDEVEGHLAPWLFTVCRHRAIDGVRKERRMNPVDTSQLAERSHGDPGPGEIAERRQQQNRVVACLGELPQKQQEVLLLKFQQGLSYRQISQVTGLTESNVGFLIHTGILTLRGKLAG
jgi:RNA polymerase sigma-70 factor (ECF subfamily)